jgi:hypothetical protein
MRPGVFYVTASPVLPASPVFLMLPFGSIRENLIMLLLLGGGICSKMG